MRNQGHDRLGWRTPGKRGGQQAMPEFLDGMAVVLLPTMFAVGWLVWRST